MFDARAFLRAKRDGRMHKLDVIVKRDGLTVRARKNYLAEMEMKK